MGVGLSAAGESESGEGFGVAARRNSAERKRAAHSSPSFSSRRRKRRNEDEDDADDDVGEMDDDENENGDNGEEDDEDDADGDFRKRASQGRGEARGRGARGRGRGRGRPPKSASASSSSESTAAKRRGTDPPRPRGRPRGSRGTRGSPRARARGPRGRGQGGGASSSASTSDGVVYGSLVVDDRDSPDEGLNQHHHADDALDANIDGFHSHMDQHTFDEDLLGNLATTQESAASSAAFGEGSDLNGDPHPHPHFHHHPPSHARESRQTFSSTSASTDLLLSSPTTGVSGSGDGEVRRRGRKGGTPFIPSDAIDVLSSFILTSKSKTCKEMRATLNSVWDEQVHQAFLTSLEASVRYEVRNGVTLLRDVGVLPTDDEIRSLDHVKQFENDLASAFQRHRAGAYTPEDLLHISHLQIGRPKVGRRRNARFARRPSTRFACTPRPCPRPCPCIWGALGSL